MSFQQKWQKRLQQAQTSQFTRPVVSTPHFTPDKTTILQKRIDKISAGLILPYAQLPTEPNVLIEQVIDMLNVKIVSDPIFDTKHLTVLQEYK